MSDSWFLRGRVESEHMRGDISQQRDRAAEEPRLKTAPERLPGRHALSPERQAAAPPSGPASEM
jgi:hypothetical protein